MNTDPAETSPQRRRVSSVRVRVDVFGAGDKTSAHAVLIDDAAEQTEARGSALRLPGHPQVPEIGDEVAVARALRQLADQLLERAAQDVATLTRQPITKLT